MDATEEVDFTNTVYMTMVLQESTKVVSKKSPKEIKERVQRICGVQLTTMKRVF
jgi:hypothetical protein